MHKGQLCACSTHKNKPSYCEYPSALSGIHGKYAKFIFPVIQYYHFLHAAFSHKKKALHWCCKSASQNNDNEWVNPCRRTSLTAVSPKTCLICFLSVPELKGKSSLGSAWVVNVTHSTGVETPRQGPASAAGREIKYPELLYLPGSGELSLYL